MKVAPPSVTQLVNKLETDGLVERLMDKEDRRAVRIKLTAQGEAITEKALDSIFESFNGLVVYLGEDKSNELADLLVKAFAYFNESKNKQS